MIDEFGDAYEAKSDEEYQEIIREIKPVHVVRGKKAMLELIEKIRQSRPDLFEAEGEY